MIDDPEREIIHRDVDTDVANPGVEIAEFVQEIEGKDATDLSTTYECVDGVLDHLFPAPPSPHAQMQIQFTYEGYRITVEQNGTTRLVKTN